MIRALVLVGLGGGIGSVFRYLTQMYVSRYVQTIFPFGTFVVNVAGCFVIGALLGLFERHQVSNTDLKFLFVTGFCGGYTTFSAFASENIRLLHSGNTLTAFVYIASSVLICLFAVWAGMVLTK